MFLRVILIIFSCYGRLSLFEFLKQLTMLELSIKCKLKSGLVLFSLVKSGLGLFCLNFNNKHLRLRDSWLSL